MCMWTRRRFLTTASACALGLMGCTDSRPTVSLMAAGSLNHALETGLKPMVPDVAVEIEAHGSVAVVRRIAEGQRNPDIVSLADVALFDGPLHPDWYATFATNAVVLAYNPESPGGKQLAATAPDSWYRPLLNGDVRLGRTDPDLDPLGYRTLFMLELASRYYDVPDLADRLLLPDQIFPETALISQFEVGAIDAAITYRSMALERNYAYIDLPPQINLSDPAYVDDWYATTAYPLPGGTTVRGGLIRYATTLRHPTEAATRVFTAHCTGAYLTDFGFTVPDGYPRFHGNVPGRIASTRAFRPA